jgi:hypothetical protein
MRLSRRRGEFLQAVGVFLLNLFPAVGFIVLFNAMPIPYPRLCIHPLSMSILAALAVTAALNIPALMVWRKAWLKASLASLCAFVIAGAFTLWLGSYVFSPLDSSNWRNSILQGFLVTRQGRIPKQVASSEVILLQPGVPLGVSVLADLPHMTCYWNSLNHGALDGFDQCDIVYSAPAADYDILTVRILSDCRIPPIRGQIKIGILP